MLLNGLNRDMNGLSKICGRQPLKKFESDMVCITSNCLKAVFYKFYLVHSYHDSDHLATLCIKGIPDVLK